MLRRRAEMIWKCVCDQQDLRRHVTEWATLRATEMGQRGWPDGGGGGGGGGGAPGTGGGGGGGGVAW